jgi:ABC-type dipeptide/oligopeptide/nickel transport system ATPase component
MSLLSIRDLSLSFRGIHGLTEVLHGISLDIEPGEKVALVGESGSGKSVTARIVLGLLQELSSARIDGEVRFEGEDMRSFSRQQFAANRGTEISMIFQDPTSSLNPTFIIERQFAEVIRRRSLGASREDCVRIAGEALAETAIPDVERVLASYPFQLSGGMNQRVMIAMALVNKPKLLIADEPGTALDVTVQAQTLQLMRKLTDEHQAAVFFISHNLGVVREFADRVYVIYRGRIVEDGPTQAIFADPRHAYTRALMAAVPRITGSGLPDIPERSDSFDAPSISHGGGS